MAKHKRKPAKGKPITSHQLFPAVVALWFGAAFGLGSLAVRPSLIEGLVLKSHIDLIVPAAAPPLGVTARILIALLMAALGAMAGIVLARRIARPKPDTHERKRGARDLGSDDVPVRSRDAHPDAPARRPISIHEELGEQADAVEPANHRVLASRRRSLALEHEEDAFVPHEMAPLPGGSAQAYDLASVKPAVAAFPEPAALDLGTFNQPAANPIDWANAAPLAQPAGAGAVPAMIEAQRQVFQPAPGAEPAMPAPAPCAASQAAHADGRQVFGMTQPEPRPEEPRQIFGQQAEGDHLPQDFVRAAGFQTSVFETETPEPLFAARNESSPAIPVAFEPAQPSSPATETEVTPAPVLAEPAEPLPSPASLGMTDLAARLADSMRRRRAARAAPSAEQAAPQMEAQPVPQQEAVAIEVAVPTPEALPPQIASFEPVPVQAAPVEIAQPLPAFAAEPVAAAPAPLTELPSALRPLALDAFIEEDSAFDPGILPPRHIVMPSPAQPIGAALPPVESETGAEAEAPVAEEQYASLLGIAATRGGFVRIEEAESTADAIEPVVIFPGQAPRALQPAPQVMPAPANGDDEPSSFRRFDAPSSAGQGQPVAASTAAPAVDAGEAEQALRAALANLQRMSGAA